jgi:hypothetical protein
LPESTLTERVTEVLPTEILFIGADNGRQCNRRSRHYQTVRGRKQVQPSNIAIYTGAFTVSSKLCFNRHSLRIPQNPFILFSLLKHIHHELNFKNGLAGISGTP